MTTHRINKVLANYGICSRRKVDLMILDRKISVNGSLAEIGMRVNPDLDKIYINGKKLKNNNIQTTIILINKPKYIITTCSDKHNRKTVIDLLPKRYKRGFFPIGRLDYKSRGALLITNDGEICHKLSHPKFEHKKIYNVKLSGNLKENHIDKWRAGINIDGKKTFPCDIELLEKDSANFLLKITLKEGRNRQIRKIASYFGYKVIDLQRVNFANFKLGNLKEGEWKLINNSEFDFIK
ncbi:MAG: pseudouridine synthase [Rickettsiales bacterium]|nr:pseudouridine synthase [Rickettsiales bacterium]